MRLPLSGDLRSGTFGRRLDWCAGPGNGGEWAVRLLVSPLRVLLLEHIFKSAEDSQR